MDRIGAPWNQNIADLAVFDEGGVLCEEIVQILLVIDHSNVKYMHSLKETIDETLTVLKFSKVYIHPIFFDPKYFDWSTNSGTNFEDNALKGAFQNSSMGPPHQGTNAVSDQPSIEPCGVVANASAVSSVGELASVFIQPDSNYDDDCPPSAGKRGEVKGEYGRI